MVVGRHRHVPLRLQSVRRFPDGVVQVHYKVQQTAGCCRHDYLMEDVSSPWAAG